MTAISVRRRAPPALAPLGPASRCDRARWRRSRSRAPPRSPARRWPWRAPAPRARRSPGAPTSAAITTMESDSMMLWVIPCMIVRHRMGQLHLEQELQVAGAEGPARLQQGPGRAGDAEVGEPDRRRNDEDHGGDEARHQSQSEEGERRNQVDEGRGRSASGRGSAAAPGRATAGGQPRCRWGRPPACTPRWRPATSTTVNSISSQ